MSTGHNVSCPYCGNPIWNNGMHGGQIVGCPTCGGQLQMPPVPMPYYPPGQQPPAWQPPSEQPFNIQVTSSSGPTLEAHCDICGEWSEFPAHMADQVGTCFNCSSAVLVPASVVASRHIKSKKRDSAILLFLGAGVFFAFFISPTLGGLLLGLFSIVMVISLFRL